MSLGNGRTGDGNQFLAWERTKRFCQENMRFDSYMQGYLAIIIIQSRWWWFSINERQHVDLTFFFCNQSFSFSVNGRECGYPGSPRNGSLIENPGLRYDVETQITYKCESSFVLFGQNQRTCGENGTWSGAIPECRKLATAYFRVRSNFYSQQARFGKKLELG